MPLVLLTIGFAGGSTMLLAVFLACRGSAVLAAIGAVLDEV